MRTGGSVKWVAYATVLGGLGIILGLIFVILKLIRAHSKEN